MKVAIVDGYVDEPSCLGVPPYVSPYPRLIRGMLKYLKIPSFYFTAEQIRENPTILKNFDISIVIAGAIVPGKYLVAKPLNLSEIKQLPGDKLIVGGIALELDDNDREKLNVLDFPFEEEIFQRLSRLAGVKVKYDLNINKFDKFLILGSDVVKMHPDYPHLICEIETYRGCYWRKCSFCMERVHGSVKIRNPKNVLSEIRALYLQGVRHFRLGRQTDFFTYMAEMREIPKPNPEKLKAFHEAIWRECPNLKTLHLDNVNPKTIAEYPDESREVVKIVVKYQTSGNVAAMGLESVDEKVIRKNNLCSTPDEVEFAVSLINEYGSVRGKNGMPKFLPGLNFVIGLPGETKKSFDLNYEFLERLLENNLLLRRINIRQVKVLRHTPLYVEKKKVESRLKKHKRYFISFKNKVREKIDREMLKKILPIGYIVKDVRCEVYDEKSGITFARQFGSYPLLIGIPGKYSKNEFLDVSVVGYGMRSVTALPKVDLMNASVKELEAIPGLGRNLARKIVVERAKSKEYGEILEMLKKESGERFEKIKKFIKI